MPGLSAEPFKSNVRLIGPEIYKIMSVSNLGKRTLYEKENNCFKENLGLNPGTRPKNETTSF